MKTARAVGETTISGRNQISLPAQGLRELGWQRGDHLIVQVLGEDMLVLIRRPEDWVEAFSGQMGDVFGDHPDTLRYLDEERRAWEQAYDTASHSTTARRERDAWER
jgi:bifunctional DNA-binding transcriptional regulator/antitoxin component of YhaV-PrlF toxin-antitoxin module